MADTKLEYTRAWTNAEDFPHLGFTRSWENPADYPTYEPSEAIVRADMQSLHNEVRDYINNELIPAVVTSNSTEADRAAAEEQRAAAETQRIAAETARIAEEAARVEAEQARADETEGIVAQAAEQASLAAESRSAAAASEIRAQESQTKALASEKNAAGSAETAQGAKTAAQSALAGVQSALGSIPAGSTLIINDLVTGGTGAALSAEQGKTLGRRPNPNLLHNWYFVHPVNQRGEEEYSNSAWNTMYAIDRWYLNLADWNVAQRKLTANGNYGRMIQRVEGTDLVGKTVTFSARVHSITGGNLMIFGGPGDYGQIRVPEGFDGVVSTTAVVPDPGESVLSFTIALDTAGASAVIDAAKLELGDTQTLAHQDTDGNWVLSEIPDYGMELAKCQRYQVELLDSAPAWTELAMAIGPAAGRRYIKMQFPLPVSLRAVPKPVISDLSALQLYHSETDYKTVSAVEITYITPVAAWVSFFTAEGDIFTPGADYVLRKTADCSMLLDANL